jgi:hypothetical protein
MFRVNDDGVTEADPVISLFLISYYILANVVLLNVVVAVLLDEFLSNILREQQQQAKRIADENSKRRITGCLDCLSQQLCGFDNETVVLFVLWRR